MTILKSFGLVALGVVVGLLLGAVKGNGTGGVYEITTQNFTTVAAEDVTVSDDLTVTDDTVFGSSSATTSVNVGRVCYTITSATGTVFYASYIGNGVLSTSTTSCN